MTFHDIKSLNYDSSISDQMSVTVVLRDIFYLRHYYQLKMHFEDIKNLNYDKGINNQMSMTTGLRNFFYPTLYCPLYLVKVDRTD